MHRQTRVLFSAVVVLVVLPTTAAAATIKAVQTGAASSSGNGTVTVTISTVDTSKSFLIFQTRHDSTRPTASTVRGRIASSTTLEFDRVTNETSTIAIRWHVVEFLSGVSVQRGTTAQGTGTTIDTSITPVSSLSQAFVLLSKTPNSAEATWGSDDPVAAELTATNNLQFRVVSAAASGHQIAWQVVEFTNAADINVQRGTTSMTGSTLSQTITLPTAVDVSRTFVLASHSASGGGADAGARLLRAQLTSGTTLLLDRDASTSSMPSIVWEVVELKDGTEVERGTQSFATGVAQSIVNITQVDTSRACAFASEQSYAGQSLGKSSYVSDARPGVSAFTMNLASNTLTLDRTSTLGQADVGWFVVEFSSCAAPSAPRVNILFVVPDAAGLSASDAAKRCAMYSWNFGVSLLSATATSSQFDTAIASANAVFVSSAVSPAQIGDNLSDKNIGIVWEAPGLDDDLNLSDTDGSTVSGTAINVVSACHYITSPFGIGSRTILMSSQLLATASTTLAADAVTLARQVSSASPILVVEERRNALYESGRAPGRLVHLPWGGSAFDYTALNADGRLLMRRSIEWAAEADGTLGIWRFDETTGTIAADSSGNGRNATLTSMDPATDWSRGRVDNALDFDGVNDRAVVSGTFPTPATGSVAFFMQVPGPPSSHGRIFGVAGNWEVRHANSGNPDGVANGIVFDLGYPGGGPNNVFITTTPVADPGRWYHVAATFNQPLGIYAVYLDGVLHKSGTAPLVTETAGTLTIGTRTGTTDYFVGMLDDLRIYDRELCADEILALARARTGMRILNWRAVPNSP